MDLTERKKMVASLLFASKLRTAKEAKTIKEAEAPSQGFVYEHLRNYILTKFMLPETCEEDILIELSILSLERTMKLDKNMIRELDQATPCDHATSESTKKVLLLYAIQHDLEINPEPSDLTEAVSVQDLAHVVYDALQCKRQQKKR